MPSIFQLIKGAERKFAPIFKIFKKKMAQGFFCGNKEWKVILQVLGPVHMNPGQ